MAISLPECCWLAEQPAYRSGQGGTQCILPGKPEASGCFDFEWARGDMYDRRMNVQPEMREVVPKTGQQDGFADSKTESLMAMRGGIGFR